MQTSIDNTVNDLHHDINFEKRVKNKNKFLIKQNIHFIFYTKIYF